MGVDCPGGYPPRMGGQWVGFLPDWKCGEQGTVPPSAIGEKSRFNDFHWYVISFSAIYSGRTDEEEACMANGNSKLELCAF